MARYTTSEELTDRLSGYRDNIQTRVSETFSRMRLQDWLRLVIVVGAYALLRPFLIKLGARYQQRDHERQLDPNEMAAMEKARKRGADGDSLKGKVYEIGDSDSDSEEEATSKATDWGKTARRRQRRTVKRLLDAEEERRKMIEDALDDDIAELLED